MKKISKHKHKLVAKSRRYRIDICEKGFDENDPICITIISKSGDTSFHHFTTEQAIDFAKNIIVAVEGEETK